MLKVNSIFESISGEAGRFPQGTWCTFIRLQGCSLLCRYCDTPQAQDKDGLCYEMEIPAILAMVGNKHVLITGGEPLLQEETKNLITSLLAYRCIVQVETNGSLEPPPIAKVHWVIDRKGPSSGMSHRMPAVGVFAEWVNHVWRAGGYAYIKWVVTDDFDMDFALYEMIELNNIGIPPIPFIVSPIDARGEKIAGMVDKIKETNSILLDQIIFSVQLHKLFSLP